MDVILAGTGESVDVAVIIYGVALILGIISVVLFFPAWRRRKLREEREEEFLAALSEQHESMQHADMNNSPKETSPPREP